MAAVLIFCLGACEAYFVMMLRRDVILIASPEWAAGTIKIDGSEGDGGATVSGTMARSTAGHRTAPHVRMVTASRRLRSSVVRSSDERCRYIHTMTITPTTLAVLTAHAFMWKAGLLPLHPIKLQTSFG